jgi:hypothetical protein
MSTTDGARPRQLPALVRLARRALAPASLELKGTLPAVLDDVAALRDRLDAAERRLASFEQSRQQVEQLSRQVAGLEQDLHEARRLNLRVAELTDLVTELVLPLHDREIDPSALSRLCRDTL